MTANVFIDLNFLLAGLSGFDGGVRMCVRDEDSDDLGQFYVDVLIKFIHFRVVELFESNLILQGYGCAGRSAHTITGCKFEASAFGC